MTTDPHPPHEQPPLPTLHARTAGALVVGSSAAVLVVEIAALRLLAPYLGLTLETSTMVIGIALAAIAAGSWAGGTIADRTDPRTLIGAALGISGIAIAATPAVLRTAAEWAPPLLFLVAALTILLPGALLAAVTPMVTKLRLTTLDQTGAVVGRLSGLSTIGAIAGTVLTGFVLITRLPVTGILLALGVLLVIAGALMEWRMRRGNRGTTASLAAALLAASIANSVAPGGCDTETQYHCLTVKADPDRDSGRTLVLDGINHSYVDLADPTHLQFTYIRAIAAAIDATFPAGEALAAYHLGGGGLTVPRYLAATRPGTQSLVSEIDAGVVAIDRNTLNLDSVAGVDVRVEDGRLGLQRLASSSRDLIIGDAFGGVSVPWHLTTREAVAEVSRILAEGGVYVANLIDYGDLEFLRAELTTIGQQFRHLVLIGEPRDLGPDPNGGNFVIIAAHQPLNTHTIRTALQAQKTSWTTLSGAALTTWIGNAQILTDDHAPVDQLLQPFAGNAQ